MKRQVIIAAAAGLAALLVNNAKANEELKILIGATTVYDSGSISGSAGSIDGSGSLGSASASLDAVWANNGLGGYVLYDFAVNATSPITVVFSDQFNYPGPFSGVIDIDMLTGKGGTLAGTVSWSGDESDILGAETTPLQTVAIGAHNLTGGADNDYYTEAGFNFPASLTTVIQINSGTTGTGSYQIRTTVPDGASTLSLLGLATAGMMAAQQRFPSFKV